MRASRKQSRPGPPVTRATRAVPDQLSHSGLESLRESEDRFKYLFDHSPIGKSITAPSGEVQVNHAFCEMLGYSMDALRHGNWRDFTHPDDIEASQAELASLLSGARDVARFIKRYLHKDGHVVWADVSTSLRRDATGKPLYFMTSVMDITERRAAEEEIRRLNAELEQRVTERTLQLETANENSRRKNAVLDAINKVFRGAIVCQTEEELGKTCLAVAEGLSGSKFGFIGELNEAGLFDTIAISNPGWKACDIPEGNATLIIKSMPVRGVDRSVLKEGVSRIVNGEDAIKSHPDYVEFPQGHPPVTDFLGVPLKRADKTIGMIGLGNR